MANVTHRERAQLLLITALGMAILFVALALVLNTGIYTENLATRSSDIAGGTDAVRFAESAQVGITEVVEFANAHNNSTHSTLQSNLSTGVTVWSNSTGKLTATRGTATNVALASTVNGTRVVQDNETRDFTNESGNATGWTLVTDVHNTRKFRMNVPRGSLVSVLSDSFAVIIDNGSETWHMNVTKDLTGPDEIVIDIDHPSGSGTCTRATDQAWINLTDGTFNGTDCDALQFAEGVSPPYSIAYQNADQVNGTYQLTVDNATLADNPSPNFNDDDGSGSPYVTPAIYSANLTITYQSARLYYNTSVRLAPGEPA